MVETVQGTENGHSTNDFSCLCLQLSRLSQGYFVKMFPLHQLMRQKQKFSWIIEAQESFENMTCQWKKGCLYKTLMHMC